MITRRTQPAEWALHDRVWIGWPSAAELWGDDLGPARAEIEDFIRVIMFPGGTDADERGEHVELLANGPEAVATARIMRSRLVDPEMVTIHQAPIGDVWLRDTGPVFVVDEAGAVVASAFAFNGWGGKYRLPEDDKIAGLIADFAGTRLRRFDGLVVEGGALETDGEGTFITTRQCLLNNNRNPGATEKDVEGVLRAALGAEKVIWLDEGLAGDHTDGHVDNLVRFAAPGKVICMRPTGDDDPNADVLSAIEETLSHAIDAHARQLDVTTIPSPGRVEIGGEIAAASHMNFYVANRALIMPIYSSLSGNNSAGREALEILKTLIDRPYFFGIASNHLMTGGGSFHCISQPQPAFPGG